MAPALGNAPLSAPRPGRRVPRMPLAAGTRLGPYEILGPLGAGGMGEVYRARDTRLDRSVAVKVLPSEIVPTPELRARFEREARAASALNHPHICVIHDVGQQDGTEYLVMELLEGETLAQRLDRGPLPPSDVLRFGVEIADALDRAHRGGIVHRDLKPGNIMLTKSGAKLMDFGLARSTGLAASVSGMTQSPTVTRPLTAEGTIVGTFQYMAPEQLEGKDADARTDLFALGAVLYEMATGRKAFEGKSQASLISAIMSSQPPPIATFAPLSPPSLDQVVRECLAKDPDERIQSAHDVKLQLQWIREAGSQAGVPASIAAKRAGRERAAFVAAAVAALVAAAAVTIPRLGTRPNLEPMRLSILSPPGLTLVPDPSMSALSPDGQSFVFTAFDSAVTHLWLRPLGALTAHLLEGTENPAFPFWSPDGRFIGYFADGKLKKIAVTGGTPEVLCSSSNGRGGSWSRDGVIVFAPEAAGPIARVSADGGEVTTLVRPDSSRNESGLRFPRFLPDGRHFLFVSLQGAGGSSVEVGSLDGRERKPLLMADGVAVYVDPGYLIFERKGRLMAQRFDAGARAVRGEPEVIGDAPPRSTFSGSPAVSAARGGLLAHPDVTLPNIELRWVDRSGRLREVIPLPPARYEGISLSPDARRLIVEKRTSSSEKDLWMVDLSRNVPTRFTFAGGSEAQDARWSPDGSRIAFDSNRDVPADIYVKPSDGSGEEQRVLPPGPLFRNLDQWTFDGHYLIYEQPGAGTGWDIWAVPMTGDPKPFVVLHSRFNEQSACVSPDGKWITYLSDESGRPEVYVTTFPVPGPKSRISTTGAAFAIWSSTGRELAFIGFDGNGYTVPVETVPTFRAETPRILFKALPQVVGSTAPPDLSHFVLALPSGPPAPPSVTVELNWQAALKH